MDDTIITSIYQLITFDVLGGGALYVDTIDDAVLLTSNTHTRAQYVLAHGRRLETNTKRRQRVREKICRLISLMNTKRKSDLLHWLDAVK